MLPALSDRIRLLLTILDLLRQTKDIWRPGKISAACNTPSYRPMDPWWAIKSERLSQLVDSCCLKPQEVNAIWCHTPSWLHTNMQNSNAISTVNTDLTVIVQQSSHQIETSPFCSVIEARPVFTITTLSTVLLCCVLRILCRLNSRIYTWDNPIWLDAWETAPFKRYWGPKKLCFR